MGRNLQFVTVATPDFLPVVCVLAESLRAHEPGAPLACYLVGAALTPEQAVLLPFEVRGTDTLPIPDARRFFFQYTAKELCCALKPHILADALRRDPGCAAAFLDADILVCAPFIDLFRSHLDAHAVLLTPHLLSPGPAPHVLTIMRAGIYNAGVLAVRGGTEGECFLNWWQERVQRDCIRDPFAGLSSDQRWLDLAVGLFRFMGPLRDEGVNVGYWNLHERRLDRTETGMTVNGGQPLRLYHFSGLTPRELTRFAPAEVDRSAWTVATELAGRYRDRVAAWVPHCPGPAMDKRECFSDGVPISPAQREAVRCGRVACDDPFANRAPVEAATPPDDISAFGHRPGFWVEHGPTLLAGSRAELERLRRHVVIGRVLALWHRWINPDL